MNCVNDYFQLYDDGNFASHVTCYYAPIYIATAGTRLYGAWITSYAGSWYD